MVDYNGILNSLKTNGVETIAIISKTGEQIIAGTIPETVHIPSYMAMVSISFGAVEQLSKESKDVAQSCRMEGEKFDVYVFPFGEHYLTTTCKKEFILGDKYLEQVAEAAQKISDISSG